MTDTAQQQQQQEQQLVSSKYEGHKAPVLSLAHQAQGGSELLLSGSEDHTARLWDLRDSKRRACLCIPTQGEVLSVAFRPPKPTPNRPTAETDASSSSPSLASPFAKDHTIFLSMDQMVLEYDLRQATSPIFHTAPTRDLSRILQNQDEVNQLSLTYYQKLLNGATGTRTGTGSGKGKKKQKGGTKKTTTSTMELYVASADDAGTIRCMEASKDQSHILHHDANGVAVVPTCAFRPTIATKNLELASGGTDCKIHLWDVLKPKKPISSYTIQQPESGDTNKPQVCNPPMVYSLAWSPSGKLLAAGLGDGNIPIFSIENRNLVQTGYLPDGHDSSVASVVFPSFGGTRRSGGDTTKDQAALERMVLSGGSDGSILCWDMGPNVFGDIGGLEEAVAGITVTEEEGPAGLFSQEFLQSNSSTTPCQPTSSGNKARVLFGIPHAKKINWMTTSPSSIFVADTSCNITAYTVPLS